MEGNCCVVLTEKISQNVAEITNNSDVPESVKDEFREFLAEHVKKDETKTLIPFKHVVKLHELLRKFCGKSCYLHELLLGSELYLSSPEQPKRNPELEERIQKLKIEQENRQYEQMTKNVHRQEKHSHSDLKTFGQEMKEVNKQLMAIVNVLITVGGAFAFGFIGSDIMANSSMQTRIVTGSVMAFIVFIADMYFLVKNEL